MRLVSLVVVLATLCLATPLPKGGGGGGRSGGSSGGGSRSSSPSYSELTYGGAGGGYREGSMLSTPRIERGSSSSGISAGIIGGTGLGLLGHDLFGDDQLPGCQSGEMYKWLYFTHPNEQRNTTIAMGTQWLLTYPGKIEKRLKQELGVRMTGKSPSECYWRTMGFVDKGAVRRGELQWFTPGIENATDSNFGRPSQAFEQKIKNILLAGYPTLEIALTLGFSLGIPFALVLSCIMCCYYRKLNMTRLRFSAITSSRENCLRSSRRASRKFHNRGRRPSFDAGAASNVQMLPPVMQHTTVPGTYHDDGKGSSTFGVPPSPYAGAEKL